MKPLVTVITPTTGADTLQRAIRSVCNQSIEVNHLIVLDKPNSYFHSAIFSAKNYNQYFIQLPWNTGKNNWNGHKIYVAMSYLIETPFFVMLDEDNALHPNYCEVMCRAILSEPNYFAQAAVCRRQIMFDDGTIKKDNRESIGKNEFGYFLYDTGTMLIRTEASRNLMPAMMEPWSGDRKLAQALESVIDVKDFYGLEYYVPDTHKNINFYRGL